MEIFNKNWREFVVTILFVLSICVWYAAWQRLPSNILHVYFLDVGQGDAIFVNSPTHGRILIDGGRNTKVLSELGKILPFSDKRIDVIIETHPDADHIGGLPEIVTRFNVGVFIEPGVESPNQVDDELKRRIDKKGIRRLLARKGMNIDLGDGVKLEILFPNQDVSAWETNDASIVAKLVYKNSSFLLTGDSTKKTEYLLLSLDSNILDSDVLKAGHHGSRTSTSLPYVEAVTPKYGIISTEKNNSYGHPHQETIDTLNRVGAKIISTSEIGTIHFETDGIGLVLK